MSNKKKLVVFTGAGISQESGIPTYRDPDGLWHNYDPKEMATASNWNSKKKIMNEFYNDRRSKMSSVEPNSAHLKLVELEKIYDVTIITQNVDNLHERAGSSDILHLHGEITKIRKYKDGEHPDRWKDIGDQELPFDELDEWRPAVVWFGDAVPQMSKAIRKVKWADAFVVIGSSLEVYPAATLLDYVRGTALQFCIDPNGIQADEYTNTYGIYEIKKKATEGIDDLIKELKELM